MTAEIKTEHPHVVRVPGVCGGRPTIRGTRLSIDWLVGQLTAGDTPETLVDSFPNLTLATVYDAISYYHDHKAEIDASIADNTLEKQMERDGFSLREDGTVDFKPS